MLESSDYFGESVGLQVADDLATYRDWSVPAWYFNVVRCIYRHWFGFGNSLFNVIQGDARQAALEKNLAAVLPKKNGLKNSAALYGVYLSCSVKRPVQDLWNAVANAAPRPELA